MKIAVRSWAAIGLVLGCGGKAIEVGPPGSGVPGGELPAPVHGADDSSLVPLPDPNACVAQSNLPMVGVWNGFYGRFTNAEADFRIDVRGASAGGGLCGTVTFKPGSSSLPPATNPDAMYPPELASDDPTSGFSGFGPPLLNGFAFTILDGRSQDGRAHIELSARQPWEGWCGLQPVYADTVNPSTYGCLPNWPAMGSPANLASSACFVTDPATNRNVSVNCGKLFLCTMARVCSCNQARCIAAQNADTILELTFDATAGSGTFSGTMRNSDVLLTRVQ